ncbi:hypothetical protein K2173_012505 [Erythroxylum novogranatense]|uniref:Mechanosensitive ion channel protein n=1 Tax=Erythroxylum novogranatense TaxID=1862640 RepID=A0AAV8TKP9_9ROSI|nr:hypothetical protein K2173_012505 [Erythroxylum novogranatense]
MDFNPLKKSFKSHGAYKHIKKSTSNSGGTDRCGSGDHEELPILSHHRSDDPSHSQQQLQPLSVVDNREIIVKVGGGGGDGGSDANSNDVSADSRKMHREPSFGFVQREQEQHDSEDPTSKLIGQFLSKQKAAGGEISLDMDMDMQELRTEDRNLSPFPELSPTKLSSKEIRVSFEPSVSGGNESVGESIRRRYRESLEGNDGLYSTNHSPPAQQKRDEVLTCTANASFRTKSGLLTRMKTKSRLLDPPEDEIPIKKSGMIPKSGLLRSGFIGNKDDDDEDDPLEVDDLPQKYKRDGLNTWTLLQWIGLVALVGALVSSLTVPAIKGKRVLGLRLWRWTVLLLVLICGRLVSGWGIRIIVFFIERNFLLRKRVLYFVYGLRNGVQNCWWLGLVLLAWQFLFDKKVSKETKNVLKYVTKILVCFLVANFIWLLKTLLVKVLALSFHVSTYFDRIQESLFNQFVIAILSGPPLVEIQRNEEELERCAAEVRKLQNAGATMPPELNAAVFPPAKSGRLIVDGTQKSFNGKSFKFSRQLTRKGDKKANDEITIDHLHKLNPKNVSAWNMKRLMNVVRHGSLATLDEQILGCTATDDDTTTEIKSEYEAKAAARKIFYNVAHPGSKYIYLVDLMRFMREDEAEKTMSIFEGAFEAQRISKSSLKNWVVNAFRERRALALTLNDTKTAVNKLHHLINIIVGIIIIVILLIILGIATSKVIVLMGSQIVVVSFIFGNTAKTLFESVIFLFIIHPFDVGDRCEVDGNQLVVEEMNILTTIFLKSDNLKVVYHNSVLATKAIGNFYRSPDMGDAIEFCIHVSTPAEKLAIMRQRIISYIENTKEYWYPNPMVVLKDMEELNKVRIAVWPRHRINHQDMGEKFVRRSLLLEEMVKIFKELDIQYRLLPLDINVLNMPHPLNPSNPLP